MAHFLNFCGDIFLQIALESVKIYLKGRNFHRILISRNTTIIFFVNFAGVYFRGNLFSRFPNLLNISYLLSNWRIEWKTTSLKFSFTVCNLFFKFCGNLISWVDIFFKFRVNLISQMLEKTAKTAKISSLKVFHYSFFSQ